MLKHASLIGIITGLTLLILATLYYPGGTYIDELSKGYDWFDNYISNLLGPSAVNGMDNVARPWAVAGVLCLTASFGLFFVKFSYWIKIKSAAFIIKYGGIIATIMGFLTVIPALHDGMVTLSSILTLILFFYITVIVLKSRLFLLKIVSVLFLASFYFAAYMYFTRSYLDYMPLVQKIILLVKIVWILSLQYLTQEEDFAHITK